MRTQGTFQRVYEAARGYYNNEEGGCPINPVIRHEGDDWMLESGLSAENDNCDFSCSLEDFDSYWHEAYKDDNYQPSDSDIDDFVDTMGGWWNNNP